MSDPLCPPRRDEEPQEEYPWDAEPLPDEEEGGRRRHDAFTERRKREFLSALAKTGCIEDACRIVGVGRRTIYRHQQDSPAFFSDCCLALRMAATPLEFTAWQRAVEGVEQEFACGGEVHVRRRYDGGLLRLLLQGSNPKKYGARPGFKRKRILKHERKQMEREIRAELMAELLPPKASEEEVCAALAERLKAFGIRVGAEEEEAKLAAGWSKSPEGDWVPPGYGPLPGFQSGSAAVPGADGDGGGTPLDSM